MLGKVIPLLHAAGHDGFGGGDVLMIDECGVIFSSSSLGHNAGRPSGLLHVETLKWRKERLVLEFILGVLLSFENSRNSVASVIAHVLAVSPG